MTGRTGKYGTGRDADVIGVQARAEAEQEWGELSGEIVSVDYDKGTATVRPLAKRRLNGEPTQIPDLLEVPIHEGPRSNRGGLTFGIRAGDTVSLRPKGVNNESYHTDGGAFDAQDARRNSLSDMEAFLDGGDSLANPMKNRDPDNAHMRLDEDGLYGLRGSPDGKFKLDGAQGDAYALLAQVVRLLATEKLNILTGSSIGMLHELEHKAEYEAIADKLEGMKI